MKIDIFPNYFIFCLQLARVLLFVGCCLKCKEGFVFRKCQFKFIYLCISPDAAESRVQVKWYCWFSFFISFISAIIFVRLFFFYLVLLKIKWKSKRFLCIVIESLNFMISMPFNRRILCTFMLNRQFFFSTSSFKWSMKNSMNLVNADWRNKKKKNTDKIK